MRFGASMNALLRGSGRIFGIATLAAALLPHVAPVRAHDVALAVTGEKIKIKTSAQLQKQRVRVVVAGPVIGLDHDPSKNDTWLLVRGAGANGGMSGRIDLDRANWRALGGASNPKGYKYVDRGGARGGVTKILLTPGRVSVVARGARWPWQPGGAQDEVWVHFGIEAEAFCSRFGGADVKTNRPGRFVAGKSTVPNGCPPAVCGNGTLELGEGCDDGNLVEDDGCTSECVAGECAAATYASTFAAIQERVFERHGCTNTLCHGKVDGEGGLNLLSDVAYASLLGVPSDGSRYARVEPGSPRTSALYLKLLKASEPDTDIPGAAMPSGLDSIPAPLLEAVREWIVHAAPETGTVAGTQSLLGSCFPDPVPISATPLPDPDPGVGMQLEMPPVPIDSESEFEVCLATYYDVSDLVPERFKDPTGEFFYSRDDANRVDPHSHHLVIMDSGFAEAEVAHPGFGTWRCGGGARDGEACDPLVSDACGGDGICHSEIRPNVACIGYGPPGGANAAGANASLGGVGNGQVAVDLAPGQYRKIPLKAIVYWNLHAFNLTALPHRVKAYTNLLFTDDLDTLVEPFFDIRNVYVATGQPPYTRRTYCRKYTFPLGAYVVYLGSHTHERGEAFWVNDPQGMRIYESFTYEDPLVKYFGPPLAFTDADPATRTVEYCATYSNGLDADGTPNPGTVRRRSHTPPNGIPCTPTHCTTGNVGAACGGANDHATCDSVPGAGDGRCDACPITAGVTTQDEMFVMSGWWYQVKP